MRNTKTLFLCLFLGNLRHYSFKKAFSLVELLIALIVISIITAAMAPTLTKKIAGKAITLAKTTVEAVNKSGKFFAFGDENCVTSDNQTTCSFVVPDGIEYISAVLVGGGGGGGGASSYTQTESTYSRTSAGSITYNIGKDAVDVRIKSITAGGGGGGGGSITNKTSTMTKSVAGCKEWGLYYLGGQCIHITTGDIYSDTLSLHENCSLSNPLPSETKDADWKLANKEFITTYVIPAAKKNDYYDQYVFVSSNDGCYSRSHYMVDENFDQVKEYKYECINGWNAEGEYCDGLDASYIYSYTYIASDSSFNKGFYRKLWAGTDDEVEYYVNAAPYVYYLYFYYEDAKYNDNTGKYSGSCTNKYLYEGWRQAGDYYAYSDIYGYKYSDYVPSWSHMAICYYTGTMADKNYYGGGGGGGGAYAEDIAIPQYIITSSDGKITLTAGAGGSGGTGGSLEYKYYWDCETPPCDMTLADNMYFYGKDGGDGEASTVKIGSWTYSVPGGKKGKAKTGLGDIAAAKGGAGAKCTKDYSKCFDGETGEDPTAKASGKFSLLESYVASFGGAGGKAGKGTSYGYGGSGGDAGQYTNQDYMTDYKNGIDYSTGGGSRGKNGSVYITYAKKHKVGAGGGGGGGAYADIENIAVKPGDVITIKIGGGGAGGAIDNNGADGSLTEILVNGVSYQVGGGTGGKKGVSATSATGAATHGEAGVGGAVGANISGAKISAGANGTKGKDVTGGSTGGNAGASGLDGSKGGCGGFSLAASCKNRNVNGTTPIFKELSVILSKLNYGSAGGGGGGGGWNNDSRYYSVPGYGGDGQDGYVFIHW